MRAFSIIKKIDSFIGPFFTFALKESGWLITRKNEKLGKILLIKFGNIGDVLITTPAIKAIRKKFPDAEITMLTSKRTCGLYEQYDYINRVINADLVEDKNTARNVFFTILGILKLARKIRKENFDLVIDFETYSTFSACLSFFSGARIRAGIDFKGSSRGKLYTQSLEYIKEDRHELDTFLELAALIGAKTNDKETEINISKKDLKYADNLLKKLPKRTTIAVHAGGNSDWPIKRWPEESFSELLKFLTEKHRANIILTGSGDEKELNDRLKKEKNAVNLAGKANLNQLAAILSKCDLFIGNDSAPMHIAAAVKTKTIGIMNCVNPKRWGPYGKGNIAITNASPDNPYWNGYLGNPDLVKNPEFASARTVINAVEKQLGRIK
jgi:heptosyltransferase-2